MEATPALWPVGGRSYRADLPGHPSRPRQRTSLAEGPHAPSRTGAPTASSKKPIARSAPSSPHHFTGSSSARTRESAPASDACRSSRASRRTNGDGEAGPALHSNSARSSPAAPVSPAHPEGGRARRRVQVRERQRVHAAGDPGRVPQEERVRVAAPHRALPGALLVVALGELRRERAVLGRERPGAVPHDVGAEHAHPGDRAGVACSRSRSSALAKVQVPYVVWG